MDETALIDSMKNPKYKYFVPIEKLSQRIELYIEMGQSIAIVDPLDPKDNEVLHTIEKTLLASYDSIYIDFKKISSTCTLSKEIIQQCRKLVARYEGLDIEIEDSDYSDDYYCLNDALKKPQEISTRLGKEKSILFYCRDFTHLLSLDAGKQIQEHMRAVMQYQQNIILVSRGGDKKENNALFLNPNAPFFRYVGIIEV